MNAIDTSLVGESDMEIVIEYGLKRRLNDTLNDLNMREPKTSPSFGDAV